MIENETPLSPQEQLQLANRLYREYHSRCFWHCRPDLVITEESIPFVVAGLRKHGGRAGFIASAQLRMRPVTWTLRQEAFFRADVHRDNGQVRLDWASDSAFRFFPVAPDPEFGYCLHQADLATNKLLALAGRGECRDYLDILYLDQAYLSLGAIAWAACGKDAGLTPGLLADLANRHTCFQESDLAREILPRPLDLRDLKKQWLLAKERAERLCDRLPEHELGCLYLAQDHEPVTPDPDRPEFASPQPLIAPVQERK